MGRKKFVHNGQTVYEWEQNLDEVLVFITPPEGVKASMIDCKITQKEVAIGIKGNPPFLKEELFDTVVADESFWTMDEGVIEINLKKMRKAATFDAVFKRHVQDGGLNEMDRQEVQKQMTLERFQEEHPGFDFSGAEFNGAVQDPRSFMGGVSYK